MARVTGSDVGGHEAYVVTPPRSGDLRSRGDCSHRSCGSRSCWPASPAVSPSGLDPIGRPVLHAASAAAMMAGTTDGDAVA